MPFAAGVLHARKMWPLKRSAADPASGSAPAAGSGAVIFVIGLLLLATLPMLFVAFPPVLDYPNHLARIWLLSGGMDAWPFSTMYEAVWSQASTNIGVDFVAAGLMRVLPFAVIDKGLQVAMILGPPLGAVLLNRALFGGFHPWQAAALFFAWSTTAIAGFLNFQIGLAAALCAAVLCRHLGKRGIITTGAAFVAVAAALLLVHPFALFFFAVLMGGLSLGDRWDAVVAVDQRFHHIRSLGVLALACGLPLLFLFLIAPNPPGAHAGLEPEGPLTFGELFNPLRIAKMFASPLLSYDARIDLFFALPLVAIVGWALWTRRLRVHAGLMIACLGLALLTLIAPRSIGDATWIQRRLPPMLALAFVAGVRPQFGALRTDRVAALLLGLALCLRIAWIGMVWSERERDLWQMFAVTRLVPAGSSLLVLRQDWRAGTAVPVGRVMAGGPGPMVETQRHWPALALIRDRVFLPTLFTVPGQQPLRVRPPWRALSTHVSAIPFPAMLGQSAPSDAYLQRWRAFDYILLINADLPTDHPLTARAVTRAAGNGFAALYRIEH